MNLINNIKTHKFIGILGLVLFIFWFGYNFYNAEHPLVNQGLGWDGVNYASWAQNINSIFTQIKNKNFNSYYVHRILPSIAVHYIAKILHYDIQNAQSVIHAFQACNYLLLILSGIILWLIGKHLKWKLPIFYISFAAIFFNYFILKWSIFNPNLTEISAFFCGITIFYFYLKNKVFWLVMISIASSFIFPTMPYMVIPLILFPVQNYNISNISPLKSNRLNFFIMVSISMLLTIFGLSLISGDGAIIDHRGLNNLLVRADLPNVVKYLLPVSGICLFSYLFYSFYYLIDFRFIFTKIKTNIILTRVVISSMLIISMFIFLHYYTIPSVISMKEYIMLIFQMVLIIPAINIIAHTMFFGSIILILIFLWKDVAIKIRERGLGLIFFISLCLLLGIDSESRQLVNIFPVFAILACDVLNKRNVSWGFVYFFVMINLISSRFWLPLNHGDWNHFTDSDYFNGAMLRFPMQIVFMNTGPWLSHLLYGVFTSVIIIMGFCIWNMLKLDEVQLGKIAND
jgi:hypothetical protein